MPNELTISRSVAPEDLCPGDYVALLSVTHEYLPFSCFDGLRTDGVPVRIAWLAPDVAPQQVVQACLPFVLVSRTDGTVRTLDVRRCRLARLDPAYGRRAFRLLRAQTKRLGRDVDTTDDVDCS